MADTETTDAAEKAYAAASESVAKPAAAAVEAAAKVGTPRRAAKAKPAKSAAPRAAKPRKAAAKRAPQAATQSRPVRKAAGSRVTKSNSTRTQPKDTRMATTAKKTADDLTGKIQGAMKDAQNRAKNAFEKSQSSLVDAGTFSKGNLEAMVESGRILGSGLQAMTKRYADEVRSTIEMAQADVRALTAVKSPTEFVELQRTQLRKYFDNVVAYNSKSAEAALKLANDAFQPISNRVSLAVEKVRRAA